MTTKYYVTIHREGDLANAELRSMELHKSIKGSSADADRFIDPVIGKRPILAVMADGSRERCVASKFIGMWQR